MFLVTCGSGPVLWRVTPSWYTLICGATWCTPLEFWGLSGLRGKVRSAAAAHLKLLGGDANKVLQLCSGVSERCGIARVAESVAKFRSQVEAVRWSLRSGMYLPTVVGVISNSRQNWKNEWLLGRNPWPSFLGLHPSVADISKFGRGKMERRVIYDRYGHASRCHMYDLSIFCSQGWLVETSRRHSWMELNPTSMARMYLWYF